MCFSIVIPAYNEAGSIGNVLTKLQTTVSDAEIIVVDDCSTDHTADIVRGFTGVRLIKHEYNQGPIIAIGNGIKAASYKVVVSFDADGQHPVESLKEIVQPVLKDEFDLVLGVRDHLPRLGERVIAAASKVSDATTGFKAMKKEMIPYFEDDFAYGGKLVVQAKRMGYRILEVPVQVKEREIGYSAHSNWNILKKSLRFWLWNLNQQFLSSERSS